MGKEILGYVCMSKTLIVYMWTSIVTSVGATLYSGSSP